MGNPTLQQAAAPQSCVLPSAPQTAASAKAAAAAAAAAAGLTHIWQGHQQDILYDIQHDIKSP
jgi:hypothetical protein